MRNTARVRLFKATVSLQRISTIQTGLHQNPKGFPGAIHDHCVSPPESAYSNVDSNNGASYFSPCCKGWAKRDCAMPNKQHGRARPDPAAGQPIQPSRQPARPARLAQMPHSMR